MSRVIVYGASDQGKCTIDVLEREGRHDIIGLIDDVQAPGTEVYGYPVLGSGTQLVELRKQNGFDGGIVAIGDNHGRASVVARITQLDPDFQFFSTIDPSAVVGRDVTVGHGSVLMAGVIVNGSSILGRHTLLCARSSLDHDSSLGNFSSLAPGATTGGRVTIGHHTAICLGASVIHGRTIGDHTVVGAGSVVLDDIVSSVVSYGRPAQVVRSREPGDPYL